MKLPITTFRSVKVVYQFDDSVTLVCPDDFSGSKDRYSVVRIVLKTGKTYHIGRELPLEEAKRFARRSTTEENRRSGY